MAWSRTQWRQRHRVQSAVTALLASATLGCSSTLDCPSGTVSFDIEANVSAELVDLFVASDPDVNSWSEVNCEAYCTWTRGNEVEQIDQCTLSLPVTATSQGDTSSGTLTCAGRGPVICEGRRPLEYANADEDLSTAQGALREMAALESASVRAFEELADHLVDFGAPHDLVSRCLAAAEDERRHADMVWELTDGAASIAPVHRRPTKRSSVLHVATHNAVEGCVFETWSAYCGHVRASRTSDPSWRQVFARIAEDETRHGQLAWDLHAWFLTQLSQPDVSAVQAAQRMALAELPEVARRQALRLPRALRGHPVATAAEAARAFVTLLTA